MDSIRWSFAGIDTGPAINWADPECGAVFGSASRGRIVRNQGCPRRRTQTTGAHPAGRGDLAGALSGRIAEGLADAAPGPEARYEAREAISPTFITGSRIRAMIRFDDTVLGQLMTCASPSGSSPL